MTHNKITIIDNQIIVAGSISVAISAEENNAENLLVIHDKVLAGKYTANWNAHVPHSERCEAKDLGHAETDCAAFMLRTWGQP